MKEFSTVSGISHTPKSRLRRGDYRTAAQEKPRVMVTPQSNSYNSSKTERIADEEIRLRWEGRLRRELLLGSVRAKSPTPKQPHYTEPSYSSFDPPRRSGTPLTRDREQVYRVQPQRAEPLDRVQQRAEPSDRAQQRAEPSDRAQQRGEPPDRVQQRGEPSDRAEPPNSILVPRLRSRKDDLEKETIRSAKSHGSSTAKRCTVDLSESISVASRNDRESEVASRLRANTADHERDDLSNDQRNGKKKEGDLSAEELDNMFRQLDRFLVRVSSFISLSVPEADFPDAMKSFASGGPIKTQHADLLARLNVMDKLFDFAEHKISHKNATASRAKPVVSNQEKPKNLQAPPPAAGRRSFGHSADAVAPTPGYVERPRAATRSLSAPRPWGAGLQNGLRGALLHGGMSAEPASVWAKYSTLSDMRNLATAGVEQKLRDWLQTIPIGNGESRGWDQQQLTEMAAFATKNYYDQLPAEQIYRNFVEFQIEEANKGRR